MTVFVPDAAEKRVLQVAEASFFVSRVHRWKHA
jgi:hypothetical protein